MNKLFIAISSALMFAAVAFAASPAATQAWVRNFVEQYVATNVVTVTTTKTVYSSNTVEGVSRMFDVAKISASVSATNDAYTTMSHVTNLNSVILADVAEGIYTNAPKHVWMSVSTNSVAFHDGDIVYSTTNMTKVFRLVCPTNGEISVYSIKITDDEKRTAKGE